MTAHDKPAFATLMVATGELFNRPLSDVVLELQFTALEDLSLAEIEQALSAHIRTKAFFPTPSEIRAAIVGTVEDSADLAWNGVLRMVRQCGAYWNSEEQGPLPWLDDAQRRAALELYGGWRALCEYLPAAGPEMLGTAKLFKASYAAYARREACAPPVLPPSREEARTQLRGLKAELTTRGLPTGA